jgi:ABC-type dipeptide/oligopeptide/nickel transport system permease component
MNKKQLTVAWGIGLIIGFIFIANVGSRLSEIQSLILSFEVTIPVLIIGCLLIYTLKDKKK